MRFAAAVGMGLLLAAAPNSQSKIAASPAGGPGVGVSLSRWGVLEEIARREWTTEKEPRPRISKFKWEDEGHVLVARHGLQSRLQFGEAKFADTVQRFVLDPKTGAIDVTYTYEDGRPPLKTVIRLDPDGTATETFTDANGMQKRNIYRSPRLSLNTIERQEKRGETWVSLGITRKTGLTQEEIAENKRRAEEARQMALAEERARKAAEEAQRAADEAERQAAYEASQAEQQMAQQNMPNMLDVLRGLGNEIQRQNERQQAQFNRQMQQAIQDEARRKADAARAEANRIASENAQRVAEANARQEAIARQYAQQRANSDAQASAAKAQADADRTRRAEEQRRAAEETARRDAEQQQQAAEAERQRREAQAAADAERRRQAEQQRLAEQRRKEEEARRPVAFKEGIVVCEKKRENYYRCEGPLQVTYSDLVTPSGLTSLGQACGARSTRDLGMAGGYRIFGCGFGIHPTMRDYPGNRDVPADYGLYISDRATFYCPRSTSAYCRNR